MVLPGCLCQVLEPLGIHVPHHHHATPGGWAAARDLPLTLTPFKAEEPSVPCHCDERPDREADECVAVSTEIQDLPGPVITWAQLVSHVFPQPAAEKARIAARGPPPCKSGSATMRKLFCVYLV